MKNQLLIFCLLFSCHLVAQQDSTTCSTIVLGNYKEISAIIDSIGESHLYYRKCQDSTSQQFSIPLNYIKYTSPVNYIKPINEPKATPDLIIPKPTKDPDYKQYVKQMNKSYDIWIYLKNEPYKIQGVLYEVDYSSIFILQTVEPRNYLTGEFEPIELHTKDIKVIKTRRKKSKKRGLLIGAFSGFVIGSAIGYGFWRAADYDQKIDGDIALSVLAFGSLFAGAGTGIGIGIGSIKLKIPINNGKMEKQDYKKLKKYAINQ